MAPVTRALLQAKTVYLYHEIIFFSGKVISLRSCLHGPKLVILDESIKGRGSPIISWRSYLLYMIVSWSHAFNADEDLKMVPQRTHSARHILVEETRYSKGGTGPRIGSRSLFQLPHFHVWPNRCCYHGNKHGHWNAEQDPGDLVHNHGIVWLHCQCLLPQKGYLMDKRNTADGGLKTKYRKIPKINPFKYKPPKTVTQKTLR